MENASKNKAFKIVLNIIFYGLIVFLLIFSIITITSRDREDIPNLFGYGFLAVESDSMEGTQKDSFKQNSLIFVKLLNDESRQNLKQGDVITFFDQRINALNTHRIINDPNEDGGLIFTRGDKYDGDPGKIDPAINRDGALAVYKGKISGLGSLLAFVQTRLGFGLLVILPMFLLLAWQVYVLFKDIYQVKKEKLVQEYQSNQEREKERMRQELLEELRREQEANNKK